MAKMQKAIGRQSLPGTFGVNYSRAEKKFYTDIYNMGELVLGFFRSENFLHFLFHQKAVCPSKNVKMPLPK